MDNSWFELSINLVNTQTGTEYSLDQGVEYYQGYEDGYSWSEGSQRVVVYLGKIPAGTYVLQMQGTRQQTYFSFATPVSFYFNLKVRYDTPNHRNMVIGLIAILLWSLIHYVIVQYNERRRWDNSPL